MVEELKNRTMRKAENNNKKILKEDLLESLFQSMALLLLRKKSNMLEMTEYGRVEYELRP